MDQGNALIVCYVSPCLSISRVFTPTSLTKKTAAAERTRRCLDFMELIHGFF